MKIIVTAPEIYNLKLSKILSDLNFEIISLPIIETKIIENYEFKYFFKNIDKYDFVILPSRNAINSFFYNAKILKINKAKFCSVNFITIGDDEKILEKFNFKNSLKLSEASTTGIYEALRKLNKKINSIVILTPKVEIISEPDIISNLINQLKQISKVTRIDSYTTKPIVLLNKLQESKILLKKNDSILFTSGAEILAFIYNKETNKYLKDLQIICFGPYTASVAIKNGLNPSFIGKNFSSFKNFAAELKLYLKKRVRKI